MIDMAYSETSSSLIDILMKKYKLMDHFNALRRYLLLGRSDFIRRLMDLAESELNKSAPMLDYQNLQGVLNKAISETNARFDPSYIISCLDIRLLTPACRDLGWDVFSLDYNVSGPLKTIFTDKCLFRYLRIFKFLWQAKRMEYITCVTWRSHNADMEKLRTIPEFYDAIHKSNIVSVDMMRIVQHLNFYFMFEVLEVSWKKLEERLYSAKDLDDVIDANETFLDTITSQLFLDQKSCEVYFEIRTIFDLIVRMANLKEECQKLAISELEARSDFRRRLNECQDPAMKEAMECEEKRRYHQEVKNRMRTNKNNIDVLTMTFNDMLKRLLEMLKNHSSENLRFLSFQFNFNEYTPTKGNGF